MSELTAAQKSTLSWLAWTSIRDGLARGSWLSELRAAGAMRVDLGAADGFLRARGATFVTLHRKGQLRGCIGTTRAYQEVGQDVADHAYAAAFRDPRFDPLRPEELPELRAEISLLGPAKTIAADDEATLIEQLRPGIDGLILGVGNRQATFLPSVWEGLPNAQAFIHALQRKAGLVPGTWQAGMAAQVYQVQKWPAVEPATA